MENRWARVTADDCSGALYIVTFLGFTYTSITFLARLLIKWNMLGVDDLVMLLAEIANIVQFALSLRSLSAGLSKSFTLLSHAQYSQMAMTFAGAQVALYLSLGLSKIATILLVRRLFIRDMKSAWVMCNVVTVIVTIWTVLSAFLVSIGCSNDSLSPKEPSSICLGIQTRYLFVVITDCFTDAVLAFIPTYLCRRLQMKLFFKMQVLGVFAFRLPLVVLAGLFYTHWSSSLHGGDPGVARTTALMYQQWQLCVSLIAATIPCVKSFIQSFDTGSGQKAGVGYSSNSAAYGHVSTVHHSAVHIGDHGEGYQLSRLDRKQSSSPGLRHSGYGSGALGGKGRAPSADPYHTTEEGAIDLERRDTQESDRKSEQSTQELVIRKDVQFIVKRELAKAGVEPHRPGLLRLPK